MSNPNEWVAKLAPIDRALALTHGSICSGVQVRGVTPRATIERELERGYGDRPGITVDQAIARGLLSVEPVLTITPAGISRFRALGPDGESAPLGAPGSACAVESVERMCADVGAVSVSISALLVAIQMRAGCTLDEARSCLGAALAVGSLTLVGGKVSVPEACG